MKLNKYLKIFVVCFCLIAMLSVSCFATSSQATNSVYGHYISPGDYVFDEVLTGDSSFILNSILSGSNIRFIVGSSEYFGIRYLSYSDYVTTTYLSIIDDSSTNLVVYDTRSGGWISNDYRFITVLDGFYIYDANAYQWWQSNLTRVDSGYSSNLLDGFLTVFSNIGVWISSAAASLTSMFFSEGSLTFLGSLCIAALAMAVSFLLIAFISRFLRFRG